MGIAIYDSDYELHSINSHEKYLRPDDTLIIDRYAGRCGGGRRWQRAMVLGFILATRMVRIKMLNSMKPG